MKNPRQRTLILSIVFSAFGPFILLIALTQNTSTTQLADFIRRTAELGVLGLALWTYLRLDKDEESNSENDKYRRLIYRASGAVLCFSAIILSFFLVMNIIEPVIPEGRVGIGLTIASLGILFNGYFAIRYRWFHKQEPHAVMDTQGKLYQAKTIVDINVVIALASILIFSNEQILYYIDNIGTSLIIIYLMVRGFRLFKTKGEVVQ